MVFLISLAIALILVLTLGKPLRKHPAPFYLCAVAIAIAVVVCTFRGVRFTGVFNTYIWPVFARGALAGSLFVLVMAAGAFPNGSKSARLLMPVRGQLSILACILTLGHNIAYGKTYFVMLFTRPARMAATTLLAALCSICMIVIMLPLFVTSFQVVRRRMKPRTWKRLQRFAYGFYALLICHILLLTIPYAVQGRQGYRLTVFVYSAIFAAYAVCRVQKALAAKHKTQKTLARRQGVGVVCALAAGALLVCGVTVRGNALAREEAALAAAAAAVPAETPTPVQSAAPETPAPTEPPTNKTPAPTEEPTLEPSPEPTPEPTPSPEITAAPAVETTTEPTPTLVPTPAPTPEPTPEPTPTPVQTVYRDGTYSGSGVGNHGTSSDVTVSVTIENDRIVSIVITGFRDDYDYFDPSIEGAQMIAAMLSAQSASVDTVSGATYSSWGLIDAVKAALAGARN